MPGDCRKPQILRGVQSRWQTATLACLHPAMRECCRASRWHSSLDRWNPCLARSKGPSYSPGRAGEIVVLENEAVGPAIAAVLKPIEFVTHGRQGFYPPRVAIGGPPSPSDGTELDDLA
jgi:hypothetical protein